MICVLAVSTLFPYTTLFRSRLRQESRRSVLVQFAYVRAGLAGRCIDEVRRALKEFRSEEHTSELQSPVHLVCRLLLEKKKQTKAQQSDLIEKLQATLADIDV